MQAEQDGSPSRYRILIRLVDIYGLPAGGVEVELHYIPPTAPVTVEQPPLTDGNGETIGYMESTESICVIVEAHVGEVILMEKPRICFSSAKSW